jgi:hypothetical protein
MNNTTLQAGLKMRPPTVEELIATVAFYGMAEIPADLLDCIDEIAADLAEDYRTGGGCRRHSPTDPRGWQADASPARTVIRAPTLS